LFSELYTPKLSETIAHLPMILFRLTCRDALEIPNAPSSPEIVSDLTPTKFTRIET